MKFTKLYSNGECDSKFSAAAAAVVVVVTGVCCKIPKRKWIGDGMRSYTGTEYTPSASIKQHSVSLEKRLKKQHSKMLMSR